MFIDSKLPAVGTTIFTVMSRLAAECGAINLSQGFPDFHCDPALIDAVSRHMREGRNQYAPMQGVPALREAISRKFRDSYGVEYDPESEITVTSGGTEALFDAIAATVRPGDEVIVVEPCYDCYVPAIRLNGGVPVVARMRLSDFSIDWDDVRAAVGPKTRLLILNSPHNPSGSVLTVEDVGELERLVERSGLLILSDEVYEHIIFDGTRHESMARHPALASRSFIVGSFGKTFHTTGWKVGYCVAPALLSSEFRKVHQFVTFATSTPVQHALAEFTRCETLAALSPFYQAKRDRFLELMAGSKFAPLPCRGSYFQLMDYSALSDEDDETFAVRLTKAHGVASIPLTPFLYRQKAPRIVRFCFAKKDETLVAAAERLTKL
ncbi:MAG TPA: methionine aminotransferase [Vicinamibacterales bacterium]|nr:methionine aminotransferase [Vicinamibacterales bacterium]